MDLTGKLLIAMPGMPDHRFGHSVVAVCAHSDEGAMGLIVNKPMREPVLGDLLSQLGINMASSDKPGHAPILFGGPVEPGRGFVLHSRDWPTRKDNDTGMMPITDNLAMTATRDILEEIAAGRGPQRALLALGYAGWGPGQLEAEIADNGWLIAEGDDDITLDGDHAHKWQRALATLGVEPYSLSAKAGRA